MKLKGFKVANVLGVLEGTTTWLVSHKRTNCQGCLTLAITLSTALDIMAWRDSAVMLLRGRGGALERLPLPLYDLFF